MRLFKLSNIDPDDVLNAEKLTLIYGDFNVLNYLYENECTLDNTIVIYPDSTAIYFVLKYFFKYKLNKTVSTDFQENLLIKVDLLKKRIFLFGDTDEVLNTAVTKIIEKYEGIDIRGIQNGYSFNPKNILNKINSSNADILFVGLGVTRQEKWISNNIHKLNVPVILSVGGWFQYLAGLKKRAPLCMRQLNLEWLYKLINEYKNVWRRYLIILPLFLIRVLRGKIVLELNDEDFNI